MNFKMTTLRDPQKKVLAENGQMGNDVILKGSVFPTEARDPKKKVSPSNPDRNIIEMK